MGHSGVHGANGGAGDAEMGLSLSAACEMAFTDLRLIPILPPVDPAMSLVALSRDGTHVGYSTLPGRTYVWQTDAMDQFETAQRTVASV